MLDARIGLGARPCHDVRRRHSPRPQVDLVERGDLDLAEVAADLVAVGAKHLELGADLVRLEDEEVARVGVARHEAQGAALAVAADHDRRVGSRQRLRPDDRLGELTETAGEGGAVIGPELMGDLEGLLEPREALAAFRPRDAEPDGLVLVPAGADPEGQAPAREDVDGGRGLHEQSGRAEHGAPDEGAEPDPRRDAGKEPEGRVGLEHRLLRSAPSGVGGELEEMVHHPERLEPGLLGGLGDVDEVAAESRRAAREAEGGKLQSEAHRSPPQPAVPVRRRRAG